MPPQRRMPASASKLRCSRYLGATRRTYGVEATPSYKKLVAALYPVYLADSFWAVCAIRAP
jgi:hypothetical protein